MILILLVGLLNVHVPRFLLESARPTDPASAVLELALLATVLGAVVAAAGIAVNVRWGWLLGILIAAVSLALYLAQETVGLPGPPRNWWDPSRIVSLLIGARPARVGACQCHGQPYGRLGVAAADRGDALG